MKNEKSFMFQGHQFRMVQESDIPSLRLLVNAAYAELADMGLNYTATYQDEDTTRERLSKGDGYVLESQGRILGTVLLKKDNMLTGTNSAYVSQLAVLPELKRQRLGSVLMDLCETLAVQKNYESIQLDTAKPATHLVSWYLKRGYQIVGQHKWEGKTYESWIFEKKL